MMNYKEFVEEFKELVKEKLPSEYKLKEIIVEKVNIKLQGLTVEKKNCNDDTNISPVIYFEYFHKAYATGKSLEELATEAANILCNSGKNIEAKNFLSWDTVKEHLIVCLINKEMNEKLLENIPHYDFLDLAIVARVEIEGDNASMGFIVKNELLDLWEINKEEMFDIAKTNTYDKGFSIKSMAEIFGCEPSEDELLYVISNEAKLFGASAMIFPEVISTAAEILGSDLYLIPSSTHEALCVPADEKASPKSLMSLIRDVNDNVVDKNEILSYNLYKYDRSKNEIGIAA